MEKKYNQIFYMQLPCIDLKGKKRVCKERE